MNILKNIERIKNNLYPLMTIVVVLIIWQLAVAIGDVPGYIMPSFIDVVSAFVKDFSTIASHTKYTIIEALIGFICAILIAFIMSILMDSVPFIQKCLYPLLIISQTIPTIAIAPIIMIWFGFGMFPKIFLIVLVCFFPIAVSLFDGFSKVDQDHINLFRSMKASKWQILWHLKLPSAMVNFFSGLKIAATYMVMTAVISEWQGGLNGIGVYMVRAKSAYALDKMFASIFVIVILSIISIYIIDYIAKKVTHWK